jgi:hypothetical protein
MSNIATPVSNFGLRPGEATIDANTVNQDAVYQNDKLQF